MNNLEDWINVCRSDDPTLPILLVASKADLEDIIPINEDFIQSLITKYDFFDWIRISSKTGENVDQAFEKIAREIVKHIEKSDK